MERSNILSFLEDLGDDDFALRPHSASKSVASSSSRYHEVNKKEVSKIQSILPNLAPFPLF